MTYNEWRDELKSNLLSVTEDERQRVLDFYAEAYADKREAGKSEREIINDFGAPYDAAQRILNEKIDDEFKSDVTAKNLEETPFNTSQKLTKKEDGTWRLEVDIQDSRMLDGWVAMWKNDAQITLSQKEFLERETDEDGE